MPKHKRTVLERFKIGAANMKQKIANYKEQRRIKAKQKLLADMKRMQEQRKYLTEKKKHLKLKADIAKLKQQSGSGFGGMFNSNFLDQYAKSEQKAKQDSKNNKSFW